MAVPGELDEVLAGVQWRYAGRAAIELDAGAVVPLDPEATALLVTSGRAWIEGLDLPSGLEAGGFVFVPRAARLAVASDTGARVLQVRLAPIGDHRTRGALPAVILLSDLPAHAPLAATMMQHLVEHCTDPDGVQGDRVATLIASMAVESWHRRGCSPEQWLLQVHDEDLSRAIAAMRADPGRPWSVEDLAALAWTSRSGFASRFQNAVGMTPGRFLTAVRMEQAQRLLSTSEAPVAAVARRVGYRSETAFGRAFRRHTGLTPSEWRRETGARGSGDRVVTASLG